MANNIPNIFQKYLDEDSSTQDNIFSKYLEEEKAQPEVLTLPVEPRKNIISRVAEKIKGQAAKVAEFFFSDKAFEARQEFEAENKRVQERVESEMAREIRKQKKKFVLQAEPYKRLAEIPISIRPEIPKLAERSPEFGEVDIKEPLRRDIGAFASGGLSSIEGIVGAMEWAGVDRAKPAADKLKEWSEALAPEDPNFATQVISGFGSSAVFFIPGLGFMKGSQILFAASPKMAFLFGNSVATALEASTEAGIVYRDNIAQGQSRDQASLKASATFASNALLIFFTNKFGIFDSKTESVLKRNLESALLEGGQEGVQQVISNLATNRPILEGVKESVAIGAIIGSSLSNFIDIPQNIIQQRLNEEPEPPGSDLKIVGEPSAIELQKEFEARKEVPKVPEVSEEKPKIEKELAAKGGEILTEYFGEIEEKEVSPEIQEQADRDWEDNFAQKFGELLDQVSELTEQIKNTRREQRDELLNQRDELEKQSLEIEQNFIEKWREKITGEVKEEELKEKLSKELEPLAQEARKYKSAEEFVSSQKSVFHGTSGDFETFKPFNKVPAEFKDSSGQHTFGTYFADNKDLAGQFGKNILERKLNVSKPFDVSGVDSFDALVKKLGLNTEKNAWELHNMKSTSYFDKFGGKDESSYRALEALNKKFDIVKQLKKQGYDALIFADKENGIIGKTTVVFDTNKILTKSQLTDFYNKAIKEKPEAKPTQEKTKPTQKAKGVITIAKKLIPKRPSLPILGTVLVKDGLLQATNLDVGIRMKTDVKDGIYQIIGNELVEAKQGPSAMDVRIEDFPLVPQAKDEVLQFSPETISNALINATKYAAKPESSRPELSGVHIKNVSGRVRITTTDSYRLLSIEVGSKILKDTEFILAEPKKVSQLLPSITGKITVKESAEHIEFEGENGSIVARKTDAKYPDLEKIYPQFKEQFQISRKSLFNALKELKPFVSSLNDVFITPTKHGLKLYAKKEEGIEKTIEIEATKTKIETKARYIPGALLMPLRGKDVDVSVNINYLIDIANSFEGNTFYMSQTGKTGMPFHFSDKNEFEFKKEPALSGGVEGAAIGTFADTPIELGHLKELRPIELPELVELAKEISETPSIVKFPRFATVDVDEFGNVTTKVGPKKLGQHQAGEIKLDISLFKKENVGQAAKVLSHELGHLVDWLPDHISKRGNVLGRLFTLREFLKSTYGAEGALDLKEIRNRITKEVLADEGYTLGDMITGKVPPETKQTIKQKVSGYVLEHAITKKQIFNELYALSKYWRPFSEESSTGSYVNYRKSSSELYADAVSALFNSPGTVERVAPTFYNEFFENLDRKPEVKKAYFELQALLSGDRTVLVKHRVMGVRGMFEEGDYKSLELQKKREAEKKERNSNFWFKLKFDMVAKNQAVLDKVREAEANGVYINPDDNPIYYLRENNYLGGKIKATLEMKIQPIYNELQQNDISWIDFGEGLFYERIIAGDRSEVANPRGLTPEAITELYNDFKSRLGDNFKIYQKGSSEFRDALREISEEAYTEGLYTDELYKQMQENPAYVTFRVLEHLEERVSARVFKQIGTLKDVDNPANASVLKMIATIRAIERNKVTRSVVKFMKTNFENEIEDAKTRYIGKGRQEPLDPKDRTKQELIVLLEKGKPKGYYVDPYIAKTLDKTPMGQLNAVVGILRFFNSRVFRPLFITFNMGFQSFNLIRDFARFWKNVPEITLIKALKRYKQAALPARRRAFGLPDNPTSADIEANNMILRLEKEQVLSVTFNDMILGHQELDTQIESIMAQVGIDGKQQVKNPVYKMLLDVLEWIKKTGDMIETLPKVAGYYELSERQKMAPREMRDFIRRKIGSPDFLDGGYSKPIWNEVFLFSNAIIQGIRADVEVATDPQTRGGWWMKTALIKFTPQTLMFAALLGLFGDDLREMMEDVSEYDKTNYITIPLGKDQNGKTIYARIPADESTRFLGGIYWKLLRLASGEKDVWKSVGDIASYTGGQLPSLSPTLGNAFAVGQFISGKNPYDLFRGRPVLTDDQFRAGGLDAAKPFVGWMWEQMGGGIFYKTYTGESVPSQLSLGERFLRLPILSNVVGRFFRISDYGQIEKLRTIGEQVKKRESERRLDEKKIIGKYVKMFNEDSTKIKVYERDLAKEIIGHPPRNEDERNRADRLERLFAVARNKSIRDPRINALIYAVSNDEKMALLKEIKSGISNEEWTKLKDFIKKEKIVSKELLKRFQRESISNELISFNIKQK